MKRSEKMAILAAVLALVCGATFALNRFEARQEDIRTSDAVVLELPADTVERLSWESDGGEGLSFHRGEEGWLYDGDEDFPVSQQRMEELLEPFEAFGVAFVIENPEDLGQYGLEEPAAVIILATAEAQYDIRLGDFSKMDEQRYVDIGDGNVYLVSEDPMELVDQELSDMIQNDKIGSFDKVQTLTFDGVEAYTICKDEASSGSYSAEDVYFAQLEGDSLPLDTDRVTAYLNKLVSLPLDDYATYHATGEELAAFGLTEPWLTVTVDYTDEGEGTSEERQCVVHIGRNAEEQAAYEQAQKDGDTSLPSVTKYVRVGESQIVYVLSHNNYTSLLGAGYDDLRHTEVFWGDFDSVTQVEITLEAQIHTLTAVPDEEDEEARVWLYGEEEVSIAAFRNALEAMEAQSFTNEQPGDREELHLTLHLEDPQFPQVEIALYRYDGSQCLAVVDGQPVSLVSRSQVVDLVEAVQAIVLNGD